MSATIEQARDFLRAKMLEAKHAGVMIVPNVQMFVEEIDGNICACALGCAMLDRFKSGDDHGLGAFTNILDVSWSVATWIFMGFDHDDLCPLTALKPSATDWHALGMELRAEFAPVIAKELP
jgi:hypothetical protein